VFKRATLCTRNPHHVAKCGKDNVGLLGNGQTVIDSSHGKYAHGTTGPVNEFDIGWEQIFQAKPINGMSVPATHFHDSVMAVWIGETTNLFGSLGDDFRVAEFVDKFHALSFNCFVKMLHDPFVFSP
jgi:hypothetical protein